MSKTNTEENSKPVAPSVVLETDTRVFTIEGDKNLIEKTSFQMSVASQLEAAASGSYTIEGVKGSRSGKVMFGEYEQDYEPSDEGQAVWFVYEDDEEIVNESY